MKFLVVIEEKVNAFLIKLFDLISIVLNRFFHKIIPLSFFQKIDKFKELLNSKREKLKAKKMELSAKLNAGLIEFNTKKQKILNIKTTIIIHVSAFFEGIRHPKKDGKKFKEKLKINLQYINQGLELVSKWFMNAKPSVVIASMVSILILGLTVIIVMKNTNQILVKSGVKRIPASVEVDLKARPNYYKADKKYMVMINIYIPVYASDSNKYQTLAVDVQIVTSIRFTKEFLTKNQTLVRDKLSMTLEPIVPEFPLTVEGRAILKDKIKVEIENLLKEQNIPGHIDEIVIVNIFTA